MKTGKKVLGMISICAGLLLLSISAYGQEEIKGPPPTPVTDPVNAATPPIGQPLVPEGVLAMQLVEALKIGQAQDEAQAESMLSAVGIEPKNGWIAGYPVTPPVINDIEKGVAAAADAGKLGMGKDQALKTVGDLKAKLGLNVSTGAVPLSAAQTVPSGRPANTVIYKYVDKSGVVHYTDRYETIPKEYRNQIEMIRETVQPQNPEGAAPEGTGGQESPYTASPSPEVINNYYYNDGPPVVTYYAPPAPYYYLYSWVPYPFWYSSFYFPGYFMLNGFNRRVYYNSRPYAVTNYVGAAFGGRGGVVNPVYRTPGGSAMSSGVGSAQAFHSPGVQSSARQIVGLSQSRMGSGSVSTGRPAGPIASVSRPPGAMGSTQGGYGGRVGGSRSYVGSSQASGGRVYSSPSYSSGRSFSAPSYSGRSYVGSTSPRVFSSPPSYSSGRSFSAPSYGGGGSFGGYHGAGGSFGGSRGGGGFSGGSRGGGRSGGRR